MRERLAYLHLPKAAGTSIRAALASYYDADDTVPWSFDKHMFGDFDRLDTVDRPVFLGDPTEFRRYRYMEGHWSLPTILAGFDPDDVACILREPRSRYLSQYTFWRSWGDDQHAVWDPFDASLYSRRALGEYASAVEIACISDNLATRLILGPHSLIPPDGPIRPEHVDTVARHACTQLDRIGFVDVIERGEAFRGRAEDPVLAERHPLLKELAAQGFTEYLALPIRAGGAYHNTVTFATKRPAGFSDKDLAALERLLALFGLHVDRHIALRIAGNVLDTYLGGLAGRRVLEGSIKRGTGEAVCMT